MKPHYLIAVILAFCVIVVGVAYAEGPLAASGRVTMLRANNVGDKYGSLGQQIEVEVVFKLDVFPDRAFGFKLRNDSSRHARRAMFDLLRDAFEHDWKVTVDYIRKTPNDIIPDPKNGEVIRVMITKM